MYGFFIFPCVVHAKIQRIAEATGNKIADKVTKVSKTHHGLRWRQLKVKQKHQEKDVYFQKKATNH